MTASTAALGLRAHSGWAAFVALSGPVESPQVLDRRRIDLADATPAQPYHEAEGQKPEKARAIVTRYAEKARRLADSALRAAIGNLREGGHEVVGCGLLVVSGRPLPDLESILVSHALIHSADGELFRDALAQAAEKHCLPLVRVKEKEAFAEAGSRLRLDTDALERHVAAMRKTLGPPWAQDQKLAALAAWIVLAGS